MVLNRTISLNWYLFPSYNSFAWKCIDTVRRNFSLITLRSKKVKLDERNNPHLLIRNISALFISYWFFCVLMVLSRTDTFLCETWKKKINFLWCTAEQKFTHMVGGGTASLSVIASIYLHANSHYLIKKNFTALGPYLLWKESSLQYSPRRSPAQRPDSNRWNFDRLLF